MLDPIDGTQGYLEGGQYAVALALVEEAGGCVTSQRGEPLDFASSHLLEADDGVVVSNGTFHKELLDAIAADAESSS